MNKNNWVLQVFNSWATLTTIYLGRNKDDASLKAHAEMPEFKKYVAEIEAFEQMKLERFEF